MLLPGILAETVRILRDKPRLRQQYRYEDEEVIRYVEDLLAVATVVIELPLLSPISRDPDDDYVIAAALAAGATAGGQAHARAEDSRRVRL